MKDQVFDPEQVERTEWEFLSYEGWNPNTEILGDEIETVRSSDYNKLLVLYRAALKLLAGVCEATRI